MKKGELKSKIQDGFSELAPDVFDAVMEEVTKEKIQMAAEENVPDISRKKLFGHFWRPVIPAGMGLVMACLMLFVIFGGQKEDLIYVALDVNPSVQLILNESYEVENLKGLNEDGKALLNQLEWEKKDSLQRLLEVMMYELAENGYLKDDGGILITISASEQLKIEELENVLVANINVNLEKQQITGVAIAFCRTDKGKDNSGRKLLEEQLMADWGLSEEQVQSMSVGELIQYCKENTTIQFDALEEVSGDELNPMQQEKAEKTEPDVEASDGTEEEDEGKISEENSQESEDNPMVNESQQQTQNVNPSENNDSVNSSGSQKNGTSPGTSSSQPNPSQEETNQQNAASETEGTDNSQKNENTGNGDSQKNENSGNSNSQKDENSNSQKDENAGNSNSQKDENSENSNSQKDENSENSNSQKGENNGNNSSNNSNNSNSNNNSANSNNQGNHYGNDTDEGTEQEETEDTESTQENQGNDKGQSQSDEKKNENAQNSKGQD